MKFFLMALFSLCLILLQVSLLQAGIRATFELNYIPEGSRLLGEATFELERVGTYEFSLKGLRLRGLLLDGEVPKYELRGEKLRLQNPRKNSKLSISFERELLLRGHLHLQLEENYLPWPTDSVTFELTLKGFAKNQLTVLIPSEEDEMTGGLAVFRINNGILSPPPLILGRFREHRFDLYGREIRYLYLKRLEESELKNFERTLVEEFSKLSEDERALFLPYRRLFILSHTENSLFSLLITVPGHIKLRDQAKLFIRSAFRHTLLFALGFKDDSLVEGLTTFFSEYRLAGNKTSFRREILLNRGSKGASFFLLYEASQRAGEEEFTSTVRDYLLENLYSPVREAGFLKTLSDRFGLNFGEIFQPERNCLLLLRPVAWARPLGRDDLYQIDLVISAGGDCFRTNRLRLRTVTTSGTVDQFLLWDFPQKSLSFTVRWKPLYLSIDPEYEIYRSLYFEEKFPPKEAVLREGGLIYLPKQDLYPIYRELIQVLLEQGYSLRYGLPRVAELPQENIVFLDALPPCFHFEYPKDGFFFSFLPHPKDPTRHIALVKGASAVEVREALRIAEKWKAGKIVHLKRGKILTLQEAKESTGITVNLTGTIEAPGFRPADLITLDRIIAELTPYQVILVGEQHDRPGHHLFELELIRRLRANYSKIAIGLEMVQRPFQRYLDEFLEGKIGERELLEKIEYYDRWGYDWRLYRDLFLFAKENRIKLVALDVPQELVKKVSRAGLQSLSGEEKLQLPELDLHNPSYENYLRKIFSHHHFSNETKFEYFYQAQVLRDEGMAERILDFLRGHPDYKMIVLVGNGHIKDGLGIPQALRRRNFRNFATIYLGEVKNPGPALADYWFIPQDGEFEGTPSLGILLEERDSGLFISQIKEDSPAKRADLRLGDRLLKVDNLELKKASQLKIILTFKKRGEKLHILLKREGKLLEKEIILD